MIIQLLPEQITKVWDMLRYAIAETFIPRNTCTNEHMRSILSSLLSGQSQAWMVFDKDGAQERRFIGFMVTRLGIDSVVGEKTLFIDCIYAYETVPESIMFQAHGVLEKFAIKNNCKSMATITESDRIVTLAERNGYTKRYMLFKEV